MEELHKQLQRDLDFAHIWSANNVNKKRLKGLIFQEGDKVFLKIKNLKTKRLNKKLDYIKDGPFRI